jgi:RimJ/RimL family protein N-acetyltransferase
VGLPPRVALREVRDEDLRTLFEQQADPEASAMAAFPSRDFDAFRAHWSKVRAEPTVVNRCVLEDGKVAGRIDAFDFEGRRLVGYWYGRAFWGRGVATEALRLFLEVERKRPLHALVATSNAGSVRVLEKCGFVREEERVGAALGGGPPVPEFVMRLDA